MKRAMNITAAAVQRSRESVAAVLSAVEERMKDDRRYLVGDAFTAADLTFASLAAPLFVPSRYGAPFPDVAGLPDPMREEVRQYERHPAIRFAARLYRDEREG